MIRINMKAPEFSLPDQEGVVRSLSDYRGKKIVLYFYPKDNTPGCTTEACSFRDVYETLQKAGVIILGISKDSVKSHAKFAQAYTLPFPILSDVDTSVCQKYGVWRLKKFMGKEYMGIARISFLIDEEGKIIKIYETVKPDTHTQDVLKDVV